MIPGDSMSTASLEDLARANAGEGVRFEYEILRAKATADANQVISGVKGITDEQLIAQARKGWRAISFSWVGRKLVAVVFERPVPEAKRK